MSTIVGYRQREVSPSAFLFSVLIEKTVSLCDRTVPPFKRLANAWFLYRLLSNMELMPQLNKKDISELNEDDINTIFETAVKFISVKMSEFLLKRKW